MRLFLYLTTFIAALTLLLLLLLQGRQAAACT
jgi:hypothetical protein